MDVHTLGLSVIEGNRVKRLNRSIDTNVHSYFGCIYSVPAWHCLCINNYLSIYIEMGLTYNTTPTSICTSLAELLYKIP